MASLTDLARGSRAVAQVVVPQETERLLQWMNRAAVSSQPAAGTRIYPPDPPHDIILVPL